MPYVRRPYVKRSYTKYPRRYSAASKYSNYKRKEY